MNTSLHGGMKCAPAKYKSFQIKTCDIYSLLLMANDIFLPKKIYLLERYNPYLKPYFFLCHLAKCGNS